MALMARPEMHLHRPDPTPPSSEDIEAVHARDLEAWEKTGLGRYTLFHDKVPVGLCGYSRRAAYPGLNLSYHLVPECWGRGWASIVVAAMVRVARDLTLPEGDRLLYGLVRPANPASARVLVKAGFTSAGMLSHGDAPTEMFCLSLADAWQS